MKNFVQWRKETFVRKPLNIHDPLLDFRQEIVILWTVSLVNEIFWKKLQSSFRQNLIFYPITIQLWFAFDELNLMILQCRSVKGPLDFCSVHLVAAECWKALK